jgi:hypothetical protein
MDMSAAATDWFLLGLVLGFVFSLYLYFGLVMDLTPLRVFVSSCFSA